MLSRSQPRLSVAVYSLLLCTVPVLGHMEMSWPYPFRSKFNPKNTAAANIDYSMTTPLSPDGSDYPCKGYQNDRPAESVATFAAGSTYNITLAGSASHEGGSCQISLSYDNGATFRVIKSMIGGCPLTTTYDFNVPSSAPSGQAILAWTWANEVGNREFYMNCAAVHVVSGAYRRRKREETQNFDQLPYIWKANLEGINYCTTSEGDDPVFPNPGPDVVYGKGYSSSSTASTGTCDSATPFGQTYKDLGDSTSAPSTDSDTNTARPGGSPSSDSSQTTTSSASENETTQYSDDDSMNQGSGPYKANRGSDDSATESSNDNYNGRAGNRFGGAAPTAAPQHAHHHRPGGQRVASTDTRSTVTVTADCESTVVITIYPSATTMITSTTRRASPTTGTNLVPTSNRPPYATGSIESVNTQYLPCVPGTFLCTSKTTFLTCNYNDGTVKSDETWVYSSRTERTVAGGMECLPFLTPYSSATDQYDQQSGAASGSYRDDRYIRERPDGDCDKDGSLKCSSGGTQFLICDHGGWVNMGAVAAGTTCSNGKIVASS